ncbi:hypothetical protein ABZP36_011175 [Zizania latifolia]
MRSLVAAAAASRLAGEALRRGVLGGVRSLSTLNPLSTANEEVLVEGKAMARAAVLNRPGHLNALTTTMGARLNKFYESWEDNPDIGFVMMKIREGRYQTLDECLVREYRMSINGISEKFSHEFREGVRARLVDKDLAPKWDPPALEYVSTDMVDSYFAPLGEFEPELKLPTEQREAFV